ncbi:MAG: cardiolipin synthase [Planctomycetota bacterium]|jgi:cardiolipin synthase
MFDSWTIAGLLIAVTHGAGVLSAAHVLMTGRTPQGVLAWIFSLVLFPYLAVPLYWVFGPRRYGGYIDARLTSPSPFDAIVDVLQSSGGEFIVDREGGRSALVALERIVRLPFTNGNDVELLIDGEATFSAFFEAISGAENYIAVQFFIVKDDRIGRAMKDALIERARAGIDVRFLFDEVGSRKLPDSYKEELRKAGVRINPFSTTRHSYGFQLNFRNHRKLIVVDGETAFVGGLNCGDEYMGRDPNMSPWRDTFTRVQGPSVQALQLSFIEDWHWATDEIPDWNWEPKAAPSGVDWNALVLPTGPADTFESCSLLFVALFHTAVDRLWISTPYFVFDAQIISALQLAALRGVDVRILVPERADYETAYFAGWSFYDEILESGCRIFRYRDGFLHQKAVLVDDDLALLGTMNLDNRSMRLNFEVGILVDNPTFAGRVEKMLAADFDAASEVRQRQLAEKPWWFRMKARMARLFAPIL